MIHNQLPQIATLPEREKLTTEQASFANWIGWQLAKIWNDSEAELQIAADDLQTSVAISDCSVTSPNSEEIWKVDANRLNNCRSAISRRSANCSDV